MYRLPTQFFSSLLLFAATTGQWPGWRGDGTGVTMEKGLPLQWSATQSVRWRVNVPGYGWSCPIVAGDKIFLTTAVADEQEAPPRKGPGGGEAAPDKTFRWELHCLDRSTGKTLWKQIAAERKPRTGNHICNTYASETPVTDGERVYAYFGMVGVFCYDLTGKFVWSRDLGAYRMFANWGTASSPVFDGDRLFVLCDNEQESFLVALDKKTGKDVWRVTRNERSTWSSPILWRNTARTELVCMGSSYFRAYDPATGRELWHCGSERSLPANPGGGKGGSGGCKASPVAGKDMLYVGMSSKSHGQELGPLWAIKAGGSGDISKPNQHIAWFRNDAGPHFTSAVLVSDRLYVFPPHDHGVLSCFDAKTGATIYAEVLSGAAGFKASPCCFDGKIFCTDENGTTFVVEAGPKFKLLRKNSVNEMTWSSPAIAGGAIYLRTVSHLYCIKESP